MLRIEDLEHRVTDLLSVAKERMHDSDYVASMTHCRRAMEAILHHIHFEVHSEEKKGYSTNNKWINSFHDYLVKEKKKWIVFDSLHKVNNGTNRWLHEDPTVSEVAKEHHVNEVISFLRKIMKKLYSSDLDIEPIESPLLKDFEEQLSDLSRAHSNLTDSARQFLESLPEGPKKDGWKTFFESNPKAEMMPHEESVFMSAVLENWYDTIGQLYEVEFSLRKIPIDLAERERDSDTSPIFPGNLPMTFYVSGKMHLFADEMLYICKEAINPRATWWDIGRDSSPEELASKIPEWWMGWLNMRLVPEGEEGEAVQLFPNLGYLPPEEFDFDELRRRGTYSILKEAFSIRGLDEMRPLQLTSSLAVLGCDIEWGIGSRNSPAENQLGGIPKNCMKWLDFTVVKHPDGDEVLLSLTEQKDESEEK